MSTTLLNLEELGDLEQRMNGILPEGTLMERAGFVAANWIDDQCDAASTIVILCGPGNNGGDGFTAARHLKSRGHNVICALIGCRKPKTADALRAYEAWIAKGGEVIDDPYMAPKADVVVVTHHHYDHLDRQAVDELTTRTSEVVCDRTSAEAFEMNCHTMRPGSVAVPVEGVHIEAVAAYNTSEGHTQFHPREREDCGYILTLGGTRIYIAGDTELTSEMKALKSIDVAFLPVNQPYTMTIEQASEAVKALSPAVFYPYHYGQVEEKTDLDALKASLEGVTDVRIFPME